MKKRLTPFWKRFFTVSFSMIFTATFIISVTFIYLYTVNNKNYIDENMTNTMQYSQTVLENYISAYKSLVGTLNFAEQIYNINENPMLSDAQKGNEYLSILRNLYSEAKDAVQVFFCPTGGDTVRIGKDVASIPHALETADLCMSFKEYNKSKEMWLYDDGYIVMCREIIYVGTSYKMVTTGRIIIYINAEKFNDVCFKNYNGNGSVIVYTDILDNIILSSDSDMLGKKYKSGDTLINGMKADKSIKCTTPQYWKCYGFSQMSTLFFQIRGMLVLVLAVDIICIAAMLAVLLKSLKKMSRPVDDLLEMIENFRDGKNDTFESTGEFEYISAAFDKLVSELKEEARKSYIMNEKVRIAAMKAYESQMNPHFLYNTLQMIQMMSIVGESDKIPTVIKCLGDMLHFSLSVETEVKLSEEIVNCESYFKILKLRFRDVFDYKIIIPKDIQEYYCPKFLIQPFVENAVSHAFKHKADKWEIAVMASVAWNNVVIIIKDNGDGISKDKLEKIRRDFSEEGYGETGIGIRNVHQRLKLLYGDDYGVELLSDDRGTQIMLNIPIRRDETNAETHDSR